MRGNRTGLLKRGDGIAFADSETFGLCRAGDGSRVVGEWRLGGGLCLEGGGDWGGES